MIGPGIIKGVLPFQVASRTGRWWAVLIPAKVASKFEGFVSKEVDIRINEENNTDCVNVDVKSLQKINAKLIRQINFISTINTVLFCCNVNWILARLYHYQYINSFIYTVRILLSIQTPNHPPTDLGTLKNMLSSYQASHGDKTNN